nr:ATP-dependent Clp protease proteolytic subunit [uncultured Noviherbaspirillum sp.]
METDAGAEAWYTLSGDVNDSMVRRMFDASAQMAQDGIQVAHLLLHSHGGYISDGLCLYNVLSASPVRFMMYNAGVVASIAVTLFLAGERRYASDTARFMIHKSHASPGSGIGADELAVVVEGLRADDSRTESIMRKFLRLTPEQVQAHARTDLHLSARDALGAGLIDEIRDFSPRPGARLVNI